MIRETNRVEGLGLILRADLLDYLAQIQDGYQALLSSHHAQRVGKGRITNNQVR